jgi:sugar phosphate isomerase/epimerase
MQVSRDAGTRIVALDFGRLPLGGEEADLRRHFARRELDEGEPGGTLLAGVLAERRSRAEEWIDHCRLALEALLRYAAPMDVQLAILPAATPWQVPTPRETAELVHDFAGAPVGSVFSPARLAVLSALGLGVAPERRAALRQTAFLVEVADAVGLDQPLALGLGELEPAELRGFPAPTPLVLRGPPDTSPGELKAVARALG